MPSSETKYLEFNSIKDIKLQGLMAKATSAYTNNRLEEARMLAKHVRYVLRKAELYQGPRILPKQYKRTIPPSKDVDALPRIC